MAETVHLELKANGTKIDGESQQKGNGRENTIECLSFEDAVRTAREWGSAKATGRRTFEPIVIRKRIDKSSPLLAKALTQNETVEGEFKFYRPRGDGTDEHFFTVAIKEAQIDSIKRISPDVMDPAGAREPPTEIVTFRFHTIRWVYHPTGSEHEDRWSGDS